MLQLQFVYLWFWFLFSFYSFPISFPYPGKIHFDYFTFSPCGIADVLVPLKIVIDCQSTVRHYHRRPSNRLLSLRHHPFGHSPVDRPADREDRAVAAPWNAERTASDRNRCRTLRSREAPSERDAVFVFLGEEMFLMLFNAIRYLKVTQNCIV